MKQEEWNKRLRDRLADHQEPVRDELWSRIEASLPTQRQQKRRIIPIMRWAVAASFLALALGGSYLMWQGTDHTFTENADVKMPENPLLQVANPHDMPSNGHITAQTRGILITSSSKAINTILDPQEREQLDLAEKGDNPETTDRNDKIDQIGGKTSQDTPMAPNNPTRERSVMPLPPTPHRPSATRQLAINLYASNNISQMNDRTPVTIGGEMAKAYHDADASLQGNQGKRLSPIYLANYSESKKHYLPLALGLTASYPLTDKFSVSTGVVYTRLRSDFIYSLNDHHIKKHQLLQYIGIPLSFHYQWWKYKNLRTYLSLGGQIDWNVKAEVKNENTSTTIDKDHCQWSVNGSLGLQFDIIPQLSLYAEPGVKHYFNNDSKIDNIFKDKPTQLNIELGLRLHLPK